MPYCCTGASNMSCRLHFFGYSLATQRHFNSFWRRFEAQERTAMNSVAALLDVVFILDHNYISSLVPYRQCTTIKSSALCFSYFIYSGTLEIIIALECNQIIVSIQSALSNGSTHRSKYDLNSRGLKKQYKYFIRF